MSTSPDENISDEELREYFKTLSPLTAPVPEEVEAPEEEQSLSKSFFLQGPSGQRLPDIEEAPEEPVEETPEVILEREKKEVKEKIDTLKAKVEAY